MVISINSIKISAAVQIAFAFYKQDVSKYCFICQLLGKAHYILQLTDPDKDFFFARRIFFLSGLFQRKDGIFSIFNMFSPRYDWRELLFHIQRRKKAELLLFSCRGILCESSSVKYSAHALMYTKNFLYSHIILYP